MNNEDYKIPNWIKNKITYEFIKCFKTNILKLRWHIRFPDDLEKIEDTQGWYSAFYDSCVENNLMDVWEHYHNLTWCDSDLFSNQLNNHILLMIDKKNRV